MPFVNLLARSLSSGHFSIHIYVKCHFRQYITSDEFYWSDNQLVKNYFHC